jgi:hypothetical protein
MAFLCISRFASGLRGLSRHQRLGPAPRTYLEHRLTEKNLLIQNYTKKKIYYIFIIYIYLFIFLYFQLFSRHSKNRGRTMLFDVVWIRQWHLLCAFAPPKHPTLLPLGVALICLPLDEVRPRVARVHDEQGIELLTKSPLNFLSSSFFIVQIQTTASLLDLRGRNLWNWRNPGHSNYHNPAILTVLKHLSCLPSLWLRVKHCNLVRPWG